MTAPLPAGLIDGFIAQLGDDDFALALLNSFYHARSLPYPHKQPTSTSSFQSDNSTPTKVEDDTDLNDLKLWIFSNITIFIDRQWSSRFNPIPLLTVLPNLETLTIQFKWDQAVGTFGSIQPALGFGEGALSRILQGLPRLKSLRLHQVKNHSVSLLPQIFPGETRPDGAQMGEDSTALEQKEGRQEQGAQQLIGQCYTLPSLQYLVLDSNGLNAADLEYLSTSTHFPALTQLNLSYNRFGTETGTKALIRWIDPVRMPHLQHLNVAWNTFTPQAIIDHFAQSPILSQLVSLNLSSNDDLDSDALTALITSTHIAIKNNLTELYFSSHPLSSEFVHLLAHRTPSLKNLTLISIAPSLCDESLELIATSPYLTKLSSLQLSTNQQISDHGIEELARSPSLASLTELNMSWCSNLSLSSLKHLGQSPHLTNLREIIATAFLSQTRRPLEDFRTFITSPNLANLTTLTLSSTLLPYGSFSCFGESKSLTSLTSLTLAHNNTGDRPAKPAAPSDDDSTNFPLSWSQPFFSNPTLAQLSVLDLSFCNLNDDDLYHLSQSPYMSNLAELKINGNSDITDVGISHLTNSPFITKLVHLACKCERLTGISMGHIANSVFVSTLGWLAIRAEGVTARDFRILQSRPQFQGTISQY